MAVFKTKTAAETERLGRTLGNLLRDPSQSRVASPFVSVYRYTDTNRNCQGALVFGLSGALGSGKTTFVRGLARGLAVKGKITSPTYVFVRSYKFKPFDFHGQKIDTFYHLDLYRLEVGDRQRLESIDFFEIINDPAGIVVMEWAERIEGKYPGKLAKITFDYYHGAFRKISLSDSIGILVRQMSLFRRQ